MPDISLKNVSFSYKNKKDDTVNVFNDFSLDIKSNALTIIMGSSGCGKTTLIKLISGLLEPDEGHVYYGGSDVSDIKAKDRNISYVSEGVSNYPHLTGFKNIAFPLMISGCSSQEIRERVFEAAKEAKIEKFLQYKPRFLSLGQNQRIAIARALVKKPDLFIFDEFLASIDEEIGMELMRDLKTILKQHNSTAIFVTHHPKEAFLMGERIIILDEGKILADDTPQNLLNSNDEKVRAILDLDHGN